MLCGRKAAVNLYPVARAPLQPSKANRRGEKRILPESPSETSKAGTTPFLPFLMDSEGDHNAVHPMPRSPSVTDAGASRQTVTQPEESCEWAERRSQSEACGLGPKRAIRRS
jgi:hypothetical protein